MRDRIRTETLPERVATLENESWSLATKMAKHESDIKDHEKWLNQVKGSIRLLVVLWTIAVGILGLREVLPRAAGASVTQANK